MLKLLQRKRQREVVIVTDLNQATEPCRGSTWTGMEKMRAANRTRPAAAASQTFHYPLVKEYTLKSYLGCYYKVRPIPELRDIGRSDEPTHDVLKE